MIRKRLAPILSVEALSAPGHFVLTFDGGEMARVARPGHFVAVSAETGAAILRKPFSIYTVDPETGACSILFSLYGPTTRAMSRYQPGDTIDILGPLGGRVFQPDARPRARHVLVGGGYGVPPLNFLAKSLRAADPSADVTLIHGARTGKLLVGDDGLREAGVTVMACTDDGSVGTCGRVTVALEPLLGPDTMVYTCGPTPMMQAVAGLCRDTQTPCQVSMETFMPCGVGICVGCVVGKPDGTFSRACTDGPVYFAQEVAW